MTRRRVMFIGAGLGLVGIRAGASDNSSQVFGLIDRLAAARTESFSALAALTGVALHEAPGSPFTLIRTGAFAAGSPFEAIEIRRPRNPKAPGGLMILTIRPEVCVAPARLTAHYGAADELSPPIAGGPPGRPVYWVYHRPWGKLSFGVSEGKSGDCLSSAVIDSY